MLRTTGRVLGCSKVNRVVARYIGADDWIGKIIVVCGVLARQLFGSRLGMNVLVGSRKLSIVFEISV